VGCVISHGKGLEKSAITAIIQLAGSRKIRNPGDSKSPVRHPERTSPLKFYENRSIAGEEKFKNVGIDGIDAQTGDVDLPR
jgi:hypothetical protein